MKKDDLKKVETSTSATQTDGSSSSDIETLSTTN